MKRYKINSWPKITQVGLSFVFGLFVIISTIVITYLSSKNSHYSFFIEFNNANGISKGTPVRMRGVNIGSIRSLKIQPNCVLTLATIDSSNIFIPKDSFIEINQTGLLNEAVVDIIPLVAVNFNKEIVSSHCRMIVKTLKLFVIKCMLQVIEVSIMMIW